MVLSVHADRRGNPFSVLNSVLRKMVNFILTSKNFLSHVSDDVTLSRKIFPGESSSAILYLKFPDASSDTAGSVWMVCPGC